MLSKRPKKPAVTARTVRFPNRLRDRIAADAERCGRSFEAQVIAVLRRHYGEDVDIRPSGRRLIALLRSSIEGIPEAEVASLARRLRADE